MTAHLLPLLALQEGQSFGDRIFSFKKLEAAITLSFTHIHLRPLQLLPYL
ncbi:MAG: hypothetical protein IIB38_13505 [Candidatus Hydrogenedentes bacterium]|nr:hypothetical protein [Candidatus Hydrogenedentota bacterium]